MKKAAIGVTPLWDRDRDSYWMLPGYLEGLDEYTGAVKPPVRRIGNHLSGHKETTVPDR